VQHTAIKDDFLSHRLHVSKTSSLQEQGMLALAQHRSIEDFLYTIKMHCFYFYSFNMAQAFKERIANYDNCAPATAN
jgi:hypothetical protein